MINVIDLKMEDCIALEYLFAFASIKNALEYLFAFALTHYDRVV